MNIDIKDKISLNDGNSYVVVSKINYQDKLYFYLLDISNNLNFKFCYENIPNHSVIEVEDEETIRILLPLFAQVAKVELDKINQ